MALTRRSLDEVLILFGISFTGAFIARALYQYLRFRGVLPAWAVGNFTTGDVFTIDSDGFVRKVG